MNEQRVAWRLLLVLAAVSVLLQLVPAQFGDYGYFIDELYYWACAQHLDWGYIDHPPLAPWILAGVTAVLGSSLLVVRLVPALCGAATLLLTGRLAARFGAGTSGQLLAATASFLMPCLLTLFGMFTTNAVDILLWVVALSLLFDLERGVDPRWWLLLGAVLGLAQMAKHTALVLSVGIAVSVLATPIRRHYATRWPWLGAALAVLVAAPNIVWEVRHDWLTLEFARNAYLWKSVSFSAVDVLWRQILFSNPGSLPLWLGGLDLLLSGRIVKSHPGAGRAVGGTCVLLIGLMVLTHQSRPDRIAALFPVLYAAGGALWWRLDAFRFGRPAQMVVALGVVLPGLAILPLFLPILPPAATAQWNATLGLDVRVESGPGKVAELPQWLADRFGWQEYASDVTTAVERARSRLTSEQNENLVVIANSYGHAGALELFGRNLPPIHSTHNNYILWGPPEGELDALVITGDAPERLGELFEHVELLSVHDCQYCMGWRDQLPIWLVWGPRTDLQTHWMELRHLE